MHRRPLVPEALIPSEEIEIVFSVTCERIHHKCRERDKNRCNYKDFHEVGRHPETLVHTTLQKVSNTTVHRR